MSVKLIQLQNIIKERILVLDGAMGTLVQSQNLSEEDFRGKRFKDHHDILSITQPEIIKDFHRQYFNAGADIVETNTFNGTAISQADYKTEDLVYEINYEAAKIAKEVADASPGLLPDLWDHPPKHFQFHRM